MSPSRPDQVLAELLDAADEVGLEVALLGGYAVTTWGIPRATFDVDLLIESDDVGLGEYFRALERRGFAVDDAYKAGWRDRIRDMPLVKVQIFRGTRSVSGDFFLVTTPLQRSAFARARSIELHELGRHVRVVSPADLVLFKLLADRPKDRLDISNVFTVQGVPDREYLTEWATRLGVAERLARAIDEAGPTPPS